MDKEYLKQSIKKNETFQKKHKKDTYINNTLLGVVERFMKKNKRICYGGTAINSILPKDKQFYIKEYNEIWSHEHGPKAVSYTHLTLPTILLV